MYFLPFFLSLYVYLNSLFAAAHRVDADAAEIHPHPSAAATPMFSQESVLGPLMHQQVSTFFTLLQRKYERNDGTLPLMCGVSENRQFNYGESHIADPAMQMFLMAIRQKEVDGDLIVILGADHGISTFLAAHCGAQQVLCFDPMGDPSAQLNEFIRFAKEIPDQNPHPLSEIEAALTKCTCFSGSINQQLNVLDALDNESVGAVFMLPSVLTRQAPRGVKSVLEILHKKMKAKGRIIFSAEGFPEGKEDVYKTVLTREDEAKEEDARSKSGFMACEFEQDFSLNGQLGEKLTPLAELLCDEEDIKVALEARMPPEKAAQLTAVAFSSQGISPETTLAIIQSPILIGLVMGKLSEFGLDETNTLEQLFDKLETAISKWKLCRIAGKCVGVSPYTKVTPIMEDDVDAPCLWHGSYNHERLYNLDHTNYEPAYTKPESGLVRFTRFMGKTHHTPETLASLFSSFRLSYMKGFDRRGIFNLPMRGSAAWYEGQPFRLLGVTIKDETDTQVSAYDEHLDDV